jgi:hypothetical protein
VAKEPINGVEPELSEDDIQREQLGPRGVGVRPRAARSGCYAPAVEPQCRVLLCGQQTSAEFSRYKEVFGNRQQWNLSTRS